MTVNRLAYPMDAIEACLANIGNKADFFVTGHEIQSPFRFFPSIDNGCNILI